MISLFCLRTTLPSSHKPLLAKKLAQRLQDQTHFSACRQVSSWATLGGLRIIIFFFFMRENHNSAKELYSLAIFHLSPVVRI